MPDIIPTQATHEAAQRYFDIRKCYPDQADRQLAEIIQSTVDAQIATYKLTLSNDK